MEHFCVKFVILHASHLRYHTKKTDAQKNSTPATAVGVGNSDNNNNNNKVLITLSLTSTLIAVVV